MVWRWIWNLFHKWDNFFSSYFHNWKYFLKSCLTSEKYSIINVQNIEFSVYYIFYGFWTCFYQILDTECNIWRDITISCYFHGVKITHLTFSLCDNYKLWRYRTCEDVKIPGTLYFKVENVIILYILPYLFKKVVYRNYCF